MESQDRVNLMFKHSGMTKKDWAKKTGIAESTLILICKGKGSATNAILNKAAEASPLFNRTWVLTGYGPMLTDGTPEPSVANSVAQNEPENEAISVKMLDFVMKENAYLKAKLDEALAIIGNQARLSGKLNLQPNAGYAKEVKFIPELASVA